MRLWLFSLVVVCLVALAACATDQFPAVESPDPSVAVPDSVATASPSRTTAFDASKYENVFVYTLEERANDGRSLLHVSYPVTEHDAINARVEAITQEFIDEYRATAAQIEKAYQEYKKETGKEAATFVTHFRQNFDVAVANQGLVFFEIVRSMHTGGTGNEFVVGFIFDRRTGAELTMAELFGDDSYLERLSTLTREALGDRARSTYAELAFDSDDARQKALESALQWIEDGTAPTTANFDNILLRENGTFLVAFDKYQVGPGVDGVVEVSLPVAAIADLLKNEIQELLGVEEETATPETERDRATEQAENEAQQNADAPAQAASAENTINCYEVPCVALTFDDGPSVFTERLLDILHEHNVKATFFILGSRARIQSETVFRTFQEGHEIGNHTWDHPLLTDLIDEQIQEQVQRTDDIIAQIVGEPPVHLRPPYGGYDDHVLAVAGVPFIFWSIDPLDWRDRDSDLVAARIIDAPRGAIILAHDIHETTVDAVPAVIVALKERGVHFVTVTKLFAPQELLPGYVYSQQPDEPN
jgi:peptidoglycan/xylan/chitin deacetylase (PgdA/CDA1 family)